MIERIKQNAWLWAALQLAGFVSLFCWVDPASRPIIAIFLVVFVAIQAISIFLYGRMPQETSPALEYRARTLVPAIRVRKPAATPHNAASEPIPPAPGIVAAGPLSQPAATAQPSSAAAPVEVTPPAEPLLPSPTIATVIPQPQSFAPVEPTSETEPVEAGLRSQSNGIPQLSSEPRQAEIVLHPSPFRPASNVVPQLRLRKPMRMTRRVLRPRHPGIHRPLPPTPQPAAAATVPLPQPDSLVQPTSETRPFEAEMHLEPVSSEPPIVVALPLPEPATNLQPISQSLSVGTEPQVETLSLAPTAATVIPLLEPASIAQPTSEARPIESDSPAEPLPSAPAILTAVPMPEPAAIQQPISESLPVVIELPPERLPSTPAMIAAPKLRKPARAVRRISKPRRAKAHQTPKPLPPTPAVVATVPSPEPDSITAQPIPEAPAVQADLPLQPLPRTLAIVAKRKLRKPASAARRVSKPPRVKARQAPKRRSPAPAIVAAPKLRKPARAVARISNTRKVKAHRPEKPLPSKPAAVAARPEPQRASTAQPGSKTRHAKLQRRGKIKPLSRSLTLKRTPKKKPVVALKKARGRGQILIPLHLEGLKPTTLETVANSLTSIASHKSSDTGFIRLLNNLQAGAKGGQTEALLPKNSSVDKPAVPTTHLPSGDLAPQRLHCFRQTRRLTAAENSDLSRHWPFYRIDRQTVLSLAAPPAAPWKEAFKQEPEARAHVERAKTAPIASIVSSLLRKSAKMGLLKPGDGKTKDHKSILTPSGLAADDRITFQYDDGKIWLKVKGSSTVSGVK